MEEKEEEDFRRQAQPHQNPRWNFRQLAWRTGASTGTSGAQTGEPVWHPAKPLLENRVKFMHCIVIIMHCLHKTMFAKPVLFSKRPSLFKHQNRVPGIFCFGRYRFAYGPFKTNKKFHCF